MSNESYFVITSSEDGVCVSEFTSKADVLKWLEGEDPEIVNEEYEPPNPLRKLPDDWMNPNKIGENDCIVIKGKIVIPETKRVKRSLEIE